MQWSQESSGCQLRVVVATGCVSRCFCSFISEREAVSSPSQTAHLSVSSCDGVLLSTESRPEFLSCRDVEQTTVGVGETKTEPQQQITANNDE